MNSIFLSMTYVSIRTLNEVLYTNFTSHQLKATLQEIIGTIEPDHYKDLLVVEDLLAILGKNLRVDIESKTYYTYFVDIRDSFLDHQDQKQGLETKLRAMANLR